MWRRVDCWSSKTMREGTYQHKKPQSIAGSGSRGFLGGGEEVDLEEGGREVRNSFYTDGGQHTTVVGAGLGFRECGWIWWWIGVGGRRVVLVAAAVLEVVVVIVVAVAAVAVQEEEDEKNKSV